MEQTQTFPERKKQKRHIKTLAGAKLDGIFPAWPCSIPLTIDSLVSGL